MSQSLKVNEIFWGGGLLPTFYKGTKIASSKLTNVQNGLSVLYTVSQLYFFNASQTNLTVSEYLVHCEIFKFMCLITGFWVFL